ncbi:MAG: hypothetical protein ABIQ17_01475 [Candidatus Limnocylindrales bacterium]
MRKLILFGAIALALTLPGATLAAHESSNKLAFAAVAGSPSPDGSGNGVINYIKGISADEPDTAWSSAFRFNDLAADATYTVVVRGQFADPTVFSAICTFTTNGAGIGTCNSRFTGLRRLAIAQLRLGGVGGTPVLQATRQAVLPGGPGSITSDGGCRESDSAGAICDAPGRN